MEDEPHFPAPVAPPPRETVGASPAVSPRVVTRPEPPPEVDEKAKTALSKDEIRALLSTTEVNVRSGRLAKSGRRAIVLGVLTVLGYLLDWLVGWGVGTVVVTLLGVVALVWTVSPLWRKRDREWG